MADSQKLRASNRQNRLCREIGWKIVTEGKGGKVGRHPVSSNYFLYPAVCFMNLNWFIFLKRKIIKQDPFPKKFPANLYFNRIRYAAKKLHSFPVQRFVSIFVWVVVELFFSVLCTAFSREDMYRLCFCTSRSKRSFKKGGKIWWLSLGFNKGSVEVVEGH